MGVNWAIIIPLVIGAILGFCGTFFIESKKRSWEREDQKEQIEYILKGLEWEINEGIKRCEGLIGFLKNNKISFSRVYTAYWDSAKSELLKSIRDTEILNILHKIYYHFDLVNFNMDHGRFDRGAAFAKEYIDKIKENFEKFREKIIKIYPKLGNKIMVNKKNHSEIIKEIQDRFRFILLVAIFFYTVMSKLFDVYSKDKSGEFTIIYAGMIALYFSVYFIFEIFKNRLDFLWLKKINLLTLIVIGAFIVLILLPSLMTKIPAPLLMFVLNFSIWGVMIIPIILTVIISWTPWFKKK